MHTDDKGGFIARKDVPALEIGVGWLGCGAVDPAPAAQMLRCLLDEAARPLPLTRLGALPVDARVALVTGGEVSLDAGARALDALEEAVDARIDAIAPLAIGDGVMAAALALRTGRRLIDADGTGRGFSSMKATSFYAGGLSPWPMAFADEPGRSFVEEKRVRDEDDYDRADLSMAVARKRLGDKAHGALFSMTGREARAYGMPGAYSLALEIGRAVSAPLNERDGVRSALGAIADTVAHNRVYRAVSAACAGVDGRRAEVVFDGVIDALRPWRPGHFEPVGYFDARDMLWGNRYRMFFGAEYLAFRQYSSHLASEQKMIEENDFLTVAQAPEVIAVIAPADGGLAMPVQYLAEGQRIVIVRIEPASTRAGERCAKAVEDFGLLSAPAPPPPEASL